MPQFTVNNSHQMINVLHDVAVEDWIWHDFSSAIFYITSTTIWQMRKLKNNITF